MSVSLSNAIPLSLMKKRIIKETKNLVLKRAKDYYENDKIKRSRDKHLNLSEEEKNKRENIEERDTEICPENTKKITAKLKN